MSWGDAQFDRPPTDFVALVESALRSTSVVTRVLMVYVAVVVPLASFAMTWDQPPNMPAWQSGDLHATLSFMISGRAGYVFYPLMLFATVCFLLALFRRERVTDYLIVRLGVYSGVVLGVHYSVLMSVALTEASDWAQALGAMPFLALGAAIAGIIGVATLQGAVLGIWALLRWLGLRVFALLISAVTSIPIVLVIVSVMLREPEPISIVAVPFFIVFFVSLLCGPFWFFAAYLKLSIEIARRHWEGGQFRLGPMMIVFTWLAGYFAACRESLLLAQMEYAKLPTEAPQDCFIATAAARGHQCVVGSWVIATRDGQTMCVTRQLQTLKAGEIAIRTLSPRTHRAMRWVYNRLGPLLARCLIHPLLADVAYTMLKPVEWATRSMLSLWIPDFEQTLYHPTPWGEFTSRSDVVQ